MIRRRIVKTVTASADFDRTEYYYYDGHRVIETRNGFEVAIMQTVFGTQYIDEPIRLDVNTDPGIDSDCLDAGGSTFYYYHQDANYNVIALTDSSGDVVHRYLYDAYGRPHTYTVNGDGVSTAEVLLPGLDADGDGDVDVYNPFLFNGQPYDTETGFYYYRTRYLDPRTGRFTTRDSIGIWGDPGNAGNGYAYVGNNPVTWLDPLGLDPSAITGFYCREGMCRAADQIPRDKQRWLDYYAAQAQCRAAEVNTRNIDFLTDWGTIVVPLVNDARDWKGFLRGIDPITEEELGWGGRAAFAGGVIFGSGKLWHKLGKRIKKALGIAGDCPAKKGLTEITVDPKRFPESARHLEEAGAVGRPLPVNRGAAAQNRADALRGQPKVPGMDLDEAPPAVLRQPGDPVSVRPIPPSDNRGAGASIGNQLRCVPEGDEVIIRTNPGGE